MLLETGRVVNKLARLKPREDHVFIRPYVSDGITRGGIILPDSAVRADQMGRGTVVAAGNGRITESGSKRLPMSVSDGDEVLFVEMENEGIHLDGERLIVMRDSEVLAVLEHGPE